MERGTWRSPNAMLTWLTSTADPGAASLPSDRYLLTFVDCLKSIAAQTGPVRSSKRLFLFLAALQVPMPTQHSGSRSFLKLVKGGLLVYSSSLLLMKP